ncbi:MAG: helix-turn-helix transcriptional regulator, partial [Parcubacteria group bacterium]|nr:helix-turn-helix transcriptional regulator [Parcubacteria group bacterium]
NRAIGIATCRSMQGPECGTCDAPSRICEACKERQVRYPDYGLCLHCTVKEYGEGWTNEENWGVDDDLLIEVEPGEDEAGDDEGVDAKLQRRYFPPGTHPNLIREVRELLGITQKELAHLMGYLSMSSLSHLERGRKLPNLVTALKLEIVLGWSMGSLFAELKEHIQEELLKRTEGNKAIHSSIASKPRFPYKKFTVGKYLPRALVVRALELIATERFCGRSYLERHLEIPEAQAKRLQAYLLRAGVIGPVVGKGKRRAIMVTPRNIDKVKRKLKLDGMVGMEETSSPPQVVEEKDLVPDDEPMLSEGAYGASVGLSVSLLPEERYALEIRSHELANKMRRHDLKPSRVARIAFRMLLEASDEEILRIAEDVPNLEKLRGRRRVDSS